MHAPQNTLRLPIPDDACEYARRLLAGRTWDVIPVDLDTVLEFMRGDVVCLRGTVRAFVSRKFTEKDDRGPRHVRYDPVEEERMRLLRVRSKPLVRRNDGP